ncbi:enoyl-CoA hydratase-related protein [Steroidobacter sp.]|uniref:enoyl-CoA hydratase-related protein n=1 Tax=Steroidobacter sp. TaxID=1978227 RepID=UPI001A430A03|nr:enoyl-CoA hydratase-related protein [Steroidobacter sp.]MBL8271105.1 enoyl-CoA hydratase/isomerase family protein [Steroidobacter sp.]
MSEHVRLAVEDGVLRITFARPDKKNAITQPMYGTLAEALTRAETDPSVRVVLFEAEGDAFSAGNDLSDFAAVAAGTLDRHNMKTPLFLNALARAHKPIVAAVTGLAVGVGVTMLLHCDLVFVADDAKLSVPFVNLALVPEAASSALLQARIGYARAYAMFALGEPIDGRTAASFGIANASLPVGEVRAKALAAAKQLATRPTGALQATKQLMRDGTAIAALIAKESQIFGDRLKSPETAEALQAFAERRAPDFSKFSG